MKNAQLTIALLLGAVNATENESHSARRRHFSQPSDAIDVYRRDRRECRGRECLDRGVDVNNIPLFSPMNE